MCCHVNFGSCASKGVCINRSVPALRVKKTRLMGLPGQERSLTRSLAVWIQYTNVTDGQTDGQTPGDSKDRAYA